MATTVDEVMDILKNVAKRQEDLALAQQKTEEAQQKTEEALRESQGKTEESLRQTQKEVRETQREVRELNESLKEANGNFNNKWGRFLENLLEGDLVKLLKDWNIGVERTLPRVTVKRADGTIAAEYDLVAVNGKEIVVVEVKTTLEKDAVGHFVEKLGDFKNQFPEHGDKSLYGAVAYMSIKEKDYSKEFRHGNASDLAQEFGLFLIKSPGGGPKDVSTIVNKKGFKPAVF